MGANIWFWIIWVICLIFSLWVSWPISVVGGFPLVFFILTGLLGWKVFGAPIQ